MAYTLNGNSLGTVNKEENTKDAGLFFMPLPTRDSDEAIQLDIFGTTRTINISGRYTSSDGTIATFISAMEALINGSQSAVVFHSDKSGANYNVLIASFSWTSEEGGVNFVDYSISMQEGSL